MVKQLTPSKKGQILGMIQSGILFRATAKHFNVNKSVAYQILKKFNATGTVKRSPGSGRKLKTTYRQDRQIVRTVLNDREVTANEIKSLLDINNVSDETIYRRIERLTNLKSYWKLLKPFINEFQRKRRVDWCLESRDWNIEQWRKIIWSDESPFTLRYNRRTRVWRLSDERFKPFATRGTLKHDKKIMIWGCFTAHGVGNIHWIKGILDQNTYKQVLTSPQPFDSKAVPRW
jgi:hypothetical protein